MERSEAGWGERSKCALELRSHPAPTRSSSRRYDELADPPPPGEGGTEFAARPRRLRRVPGLTVAAGPNQATRHRAGVLAALEDRRAGDQRRHGLGEENTRSSRAGPRALTAMLNSTGSWGLA